jgi:signal transduction histidine kinase
MILKYFCVTFFILFTQQIAAQSSNYSIQQYNSENGFQNSLKGIEVDKRGYVWFATESVLVRYDGKQFKQYSATNFPVIKINRISYIGLTKDSNIYIVSDGNKFYTWSYKGVLEYMSPEEISRKIDNSVANVNPYDVYGVCRSKFNHKLIPAWALPDFQLINKSFFNSIVYRNGHYYFFNSSRALIEADTALSQFKKLSFENILIAKTSSETLQPATASLIRQGREIYLRYGEMIYRLDFLKHQNLVSAEPVLKIGNISNVNCFLQLPSYNISMVGTRADGIFIFKREDFSTLLFKDVEANIAYAEAPYRDSGIITKKGVLFPRKSRLLPAGFALESILKTSEGTYYLNRRGDEKNSGIVELDDNLHEIRTIYEYVLSVRCFQQLKDGSVWLAVDNRFLGEVVGDHIAWIKPPQGLPKDLRINTFIEAGKNEFWIACNKGFAKFNVATNHISFIPELNNINVRTLYTDKRNILWIGTYGNGFYAWYKEKLISFPQDQNNYLDNANGFIEDKNSFLWISTNHGLFQVASKDLYHYLDDQSQSIYYYYHDHAEGFLTNEFNGGCTPSAIQLGNGKISFPSIKGFVQFNPDSIKPILPTAEIYVDAVLADTTSFYDESNIKILHRTNHVQFFVSSPYFGNSYNQTIQYKLKGVSNTWYTINESGYIEFNQLRGGNYSLLLRKQTGFGTNSFCTKEISFYVQPAIYDTWFFRVLMLGLLAGLIYLIYRFRVHYLLRQKSKLQKEVFERTKEQTALIKNLEDVIAELEQSQDSLYNTVLFKEKLAMIISHDIQSPLRFLSEAANKAYEKSLQNSFSDITELTKELKNTSQNIYHFVQDFNSWINSMDKNFNLQNNWVNLSELMNELSVFFTELVKVKNNKIILEADSSATIYSDYQLLKIILRNIIDNANKHTINGTICVTLHTHGDKASITITDTGKGIDALTLSKLNKRIRHYVHHDFTKEKEIGFGYRFVIDFCKLLNIHLSIESNPGSGTAIQLKNLECKRNVIFKTGVSL